MNLLQLCETTIERCGITLSGPLTTAENQSGEILQVVNWVKQSWLEVQLAQSNWDWMNADFSFQTEAGKQEYLVSEANATNFSKWLPDTFRIYKASIGKGDDTFLEEDSWQSFRDLYMFGVQQPNKPSVFAIRRRNKSLCMGPIPDDIYTVYGEYQKAATALVEDEDIPGMPQDYHMLIVHAARMKYAAFENAPEVWAEASKDFDWNMNKLVELNLSEIGLGSPLA